MVNLDKLIQKVVDASRKADRNATSAEINVGHAVHRAIITAVSRVRDAKGKRSARADTLAAVVERLQVEGCRKVNLNRAVQIRHVALLFGVDNARTLPVDVVASFARLIRRDAKREEWLLREKTASPATALWTRVVTDDVLPTDVRCEVDAILGVTPRPPRPKKPKPTGRQVFAAFVSSAGPKDLGLALTALQTEDSDAFTRLAKMVGRLRKKSTPLPVEADPITAPAISVLEPPAPRGFLGRKAA